MDQILEAAVAFDNIVGAADTECDNLFDSLNEVLRELGDDYNDPLALTRRPLDYSPTTATTGGTTTSGTTSGTTTGASRVGGIGAVNNSLLHTSYDPTHSRNTVAATWRNTAHTTAGTYTGAVSQRSAKNDTRRQSMFGSIGMCTGTDTTVQQVDYEVAYESDPYCSSIVNGTASSALAGGGMLSTRRAEHYRNLFASRMSLHDVTAAMTARAAPPAPYCTAREAYAPAEQQHMYRRAYGGGGGTARLISDTLYRSSKTLPLSKSMTSRMATTAATHCTTNAAAAHCTTTAAAAHCTATTAQRRRSLSTRRHKSLQHSAAATAATKDLRRTSFNKLQNSPQPTDNYSERTGGMGTGTGGMGTGSSSSYRRRRAGLRSRPAVVPRLNLNAALRHNFAENMAPSSKNSVSGSTIKDKLAKKLMKEDRHSPTAAQHRAQCSSGRLLIGRSRTGLLRRTEATTVISSRRSCGKESVAGQMRTTGRMALQGGCLSKKRVPAANAGRRPYAKAAYAHVHAKKQYTPHNDIVVPKCCSAVGSTQCSKVHTPHNEIVVAEATAPYSSTVECLIPQSTQLQPLGHTKALQRGDGHGRLTTDDGYEDEYTALEQTKQLATQCDDAISISSTSSSAESCIATDSEYEDGSTTFGGDRFLQHVPSAAHSSAAHSSAAHSSRRSSSCSRSRSSCSSSSSSAAVECGAESDCSGYDSRPTAAYDNGHGSGLHPTADCTISDEGGDHQRRVDASAPPMYTANEAERYLGSLRSLQEVVDSSIAPSVKRLVMERRKLLGRQSKLEEMLEKADTEMAEKTFELSRLTEALHTEHSNVKTLREANTQLQATTARNLDEERDERLSAEAALVSYRDHNASLQQLMLNAKEQLNVLRSSAVHNSPSLRRRNLSVTPLTALTMMMPAVQCSGTQYSGATRSSSSSSTAVHNDNFIMPMAAPCKVQHAVATVKDSDLNLDDFHQHINQDKHRAKSVATGSTLASTNSEAVECPLVCGVGDCDDINNNYNIDAAAEAERVSVLPVLLRRVETGEDAQQCTAHQSLQCSSTCNTVTLAAGGLRCCNTVGSANDDVAEEDTVSSPLGAQQCSSGQHYTYNSSSSDDYSFEVAGRHLDDYGNDLLYASMHERSPQQAYLQKSLMEELEELQSPNIAIMSGTGGMAFDTDMTNNNVPPVHSKVLLKKAYTSKCKISKQFGIRKRPTCSTKVKKLCRKTLLESRRTADDMPAPDPVVALVMPPKPTEYMQHAVRFESAQGHNSTTKAAGLFASTVWSAGAIACAHSHNSHYLHNHNKVNDGMHLKAHDPNMHSCSENGMHLKAHDPNIHSHRSDDGCGVVVTSPYICQEDHHFALPLNFSSVGRRVLPSGALGVWGDTSSTSSTEGTERCSTAAVQSRGAAVQSTSVSSRYRSRYMIPGMLSLMRTINRFREVFFR